MAWMAPSLRSVDTMIEVFSAGNANLVVKEADATGF
jgi:hypothetical protein